MTEFHFGSLVFDDFVEEDGKYWSYICNYHSTRVNQSQLDEAGKCDCTCGVKGCENTSDFYVDF